jgi:hypothetical protein
MRPPACATAGALAALAACSPALDWRELVVDGADLVAAFPCRPHRVARTLPLAGRAVQMQMASCTDDGVTYAVSWADVGDPATVRAALEALRRAAAANLGTSEGTPVPFAPHGATPSEVAVRIDIAGRLPDGRAVHEHAAFFALGMRVYQASLIGVAPSQAAIDGFLAGLSFRNHP